MKQARAFLEAGNLGAAIEELTRAVRGNPTDTAQRTFLFELLCFAGDWDRAEKQLDVIADQSTQADLGAQVYRNNIKAERDRQRLFAQGLEPHFVAEPPAHVDFHLAAINRLREGSVREARETLNRAENERPALPGMLDGRPFEDFRDYDDVMGPVLELIIRDQYTWLPWEHVKRVEIDPPKRLRDLLWAPARVQATDGTVGQVFLLVLYAGSSQHQNDQVRLGRMTDWREMGEDVYLAAGAHLLLVDGEEKALLELRSVDFGPPEAASGSA
jgi:type VI secretion system protein ImpE